MFLLHSIGSCVYVAIFIFRLGLLQRWKEKNGPLATYRALAECLFNGKAIDSVDTLCKVLAASKPAPHMTHTSSTAQPMEGTLSYFRHTSTAVIRFSHDPQYHHELVRHRDLQSCIASQTVACRTMYIAHISS